MENNKLTWEDVIKNINKPVWDYKRKEWRVVDGYRELKRELKNEKCVSFTDSGDWYKINELDLYKEETWKV